jgi:hypothetical protein
MRTTVSVCGFQARIALGTLGLAIILTILGPASAQSVHPWTNLVSATFQILADLPGWPVRCTGWYAAPRGRVSSMTVSLYITAGHCDAPHIARVTEGLEEMAVLARITRPGVDAAVGARFDPRATRTFPVLAAVLPPAGDQALVVGYSAGHLTEAVLTVLPTCQHGFLCLHSDRILRPGMSGAPIVSLRTGDIVGILVGSPMDARGHEDPNTIWATPSVALRSLVELAAPAPIRDGSPLDGGQIGL